MNQVRSVPARVCSPGADPHVSLDAPRSCCRRLPPPQGRRSRLKYKFRCLSRFCSASIACCPAFCAAALSPD